MLRLRVRETEKGVFTHEQMGRLLANSEGDWQLAVQLAYYTGARLKTVTKMRWD